LSNDKEGEDVEFPNVEWRNYLQKWLEVPTVVKVLDLPKGVRILEVGCGRGIALPTLIRLLDPISITGLDIDGDLIAIAKKRMAKRGFKVNLVQDDVRQMPFEDGSFDLVIDFGTCYHISNADAALREISRVLSEGGSFVSETYMNQIFAHMVDSPNRNKVPWESEPSLTVEKRVLLWSKRKKSELV